MKYLVILMCLVMALLSFQVYRLTQRLHAQEAHTLSLMVSVTELLEDKLEGKPEIEYSK